MKEKLHPIHVSILVFMSQSGVVVFSLPRLLAEHMGYNGWITLIIFSGIVMLNILLISLVYRLGRGKSIFLIVEQALPKILVFPFYIILVSIWVILGCMITKQYVIIFQLFVFPTTHPMLIKVLVDTLAYILVIKGIYSISKASTSFFILVIWTNLLLLFFVKDFNWLNFTPFLLQDTTQEILGSLNIYASFLGYEIVLLLFPYTEKKGFIKAVYIGNLINTVTYLAVCLICFGFYSFNQLKRMKYPLIDLLSYIELPFVERIENLFFGFFLFTTLLGTTLYFWAATETAQRVIPKVNIRWIVFFLISCSFIVSWIPNTLNEVEKWLAALSYIEIGVAFGLPILLLLILSVSKGAKKHA